MPGRGRACQPRRHMVGRRNDNMAARNGRHHEPAPDPASEPAVSGPWGKSLRPPCNTNTGDAGEADENNQNITDFEEITHTACVLPCCHKLVEDEACTNNVICSPPVTNSIGNIQTQCMSRSSVPQINVYPQFAQTN